MANNEYLCRYKRDNGSICHAITRADDDARAMRLAFSRTSSVSWRGSKLCTVLKEDAAGDFTEIVWDYLLSQ